MQRRLNRLDILSRRREPPPVCQTCDLDRLDMSEKVELDQLLAKLEGLAPRPNGRADLTPLADDELNRLTELAEKMMTTEVA